MTSNVGAIDIVRDKIGFLNEKSIQDNEIQFLIATVLIHGFILPIKYLIYKLFVFKDSLNN